MKELIYDFKITDEFILNKFRNSLVLDIETTGLSRQYNSIFLIGICNIEENAKIQLFFAENLVEEINILKKIKPYLNKNIITFNGNSFDLPFLKEKFDFYNISTPNLSGFDLYRYVRNHKHILNLENYKQKTIEEHIGIYRDEFISGRDVIYAYQDYLENKNYSKFEDVIIHNKDDIMGLTSSLSIVEQIEKINSISIQEKIFTISNISFLKNNLSIEGFTNFSDNYVFNHFNYSLECTNRSFKISLPTYIENYDDKRKCNFILKDDFPNIIDRTKIPSPKEIFLLKLDGILFQNIYELVEFMLKENF